MQQSINYNHILIVSEIVNNCDTRECVKKVLTKYVGVSVSETDDSIICEFDNQKITFVFDDFGLSEIVFDDEKPVKILNYSYSDHGVNYEYD